MSPTKPFPLPRLLDPLAVCVPVAVYAIWVTSGGYQPNNDAYYHVACARLYATQGWLSDFPWLPLTVLGDSFPNVHLGLHLVLLPLTLVLPPLIALKTAVVLMSSGVVISIYLVLRRWNVPAAGLWAMLGPLASPLFVSWGSSLKGGSLFFILMIWFIDALWAGSVRRSFLLAWAAVYAYVGAPVLVPVLAAHLLVVRMREGRWAWRPAAAGVGGLMTGYVVNPFWPDQWIHTARELSGGLAGYLANAGQFVGYEWISPPLELVIRFAFLYLLFWTVMLVRDLARFRPVPAGALAGAVTALGLFGASLLGVKHFQLFFVASCLFIPLHFAATGPWRRSTTAVLLVVAVLTAAWSVRTSWSDLHTAGRVPAQDYRLIGEQLRELTPAGQMVVAPWDDFPGLFFYNTHNRYAVGMNVAFLRWASEDRFHAYFRLYRGRVEDPGAVVARHFDDAELILVRPAMHGALLRTLLRTPGCTEIPSRAASWRLFRFERRWSP